MSNNNKRPQTFKLELSTSVTGGVNVVLTKNARTKADRDETLLWFKDVEGIGASCGTDRNTLALAVGALVTEALRKVDGLNHVDGTIKLSVTK